MHPAKKAKTVQGAEKKGGILNDFDCSSTSTKALSDGSSYYDSSD